MKKKKVTRADIFDNVRKDHPGITDAEIEEAFAGLMSRPDEDRYAMWMEAMEQVLNERASVEELEAELTKVQQKTYAPTTGISSERQKADHIQAIETEITRRHNLMDLEETQACVHSVPETWYPTYLAEITKEVQRLQALATEVDHKAKYGVVHDWLVAEAEADVRAAKFAEVLSGDYLDKDHG